MLTYRRYGAECLGLYDKIPMLVDVTNEFIIEKIDRGLGGFLLAETPVKPYVKNFCLGPDETVRRWERWDLSNWAFFIASDAERPVGAAAVASRTAGLDMLRGRDDLAVLWDIRVDGGYRRRGIGKALFEMAVEWSYANGMTQLKIECQTNNVPAVRFYHGRGAVLCAYDEHAYRDDPVPEHRREVQLIWILDL